MAKSTSNVTITFDPYTDKGRSELIQTLIYETKLGYSSDVMLLKLAHAIVRELADTYLNCEEASIEDVLERRLPVERHAEHVQVRTTLDHLYNQFVTTLFMVKRLEPHLKS